MKKTGPIREKTITVGGLSCKSKETRGFLCKTAKSRRVWLETAGLTRGRRIWSVGSRSGGSNQAGEAARTRVDPDPSDQDQTAQDAHERPGGGGRPTVAWPRQRPAVARWHNRGPGAGCPICRADYPGSKRASTQTSQGRQGRYRSGGDGAKGGGTSPATPPRRCGAPRRKQVAPMGPLPCGGAPGDLHGDKGTADGAAHGGSATTVRRRRGASSARVGGEGGRRGERRWD
jgi:hypothetical protein